MKRPFIMCLLAAVLFASGCVQSTPKSTAEIPQEERPLFDASYGFVKCSFTNYATMLEADPDLGDDLKQGLEKVALQACDNCQKELDAYSGFLAEKVDQSFADKHTELLKQQTRDAMVARVLVDVDSVQE